MRIGQKINEFDNSIGTVRAFNEIFPDTPLKNSRGKNLANGEVEIGGIVGIGNDTKRFVTLITTDLEGNDIVDKFEHDFYPEKVAYASTQVFSKERRKKMSKAAKIRNMPHEFVVRKDGKELGRFNFAKEAAKLVGVSQSTLSQYIAGRWKNSEGYVVTKEKK